MPMQDVKKTDMKSETNVKRVRRRNRWLPLYIAVVLVLTAGVGVALSTTVFFNVENIVVTGEAEQYTVTDIVKAADVCSGDNLIKLNTDEVAKRVYDNLIYIETVDVQKKFPDELVINVQKCRNLIILFMITEFYWQVRPERLFPTAWKLRRGCRSFMDICRRFFLPEKS